MWETFHVPQVKQWSHSLSFVVNLLVHVWILLTFLTLFFFKYVAGLTESHVDAEMKSLVQQQTTQLLELMHQNTRLTELTARSHIDLPPHTSERVIRVIDQATQVAAIVDLVLERSPAFGLTSGTQSSGDHAVERLRSLTRLARMTAVNTIISESEQSLR